MRTIAKLLALFFLFIMTSCALSLYPLYTDKDLISDPNLLGIWAEKDSKETWEFIQGEDKAYKLIYTDDKGKKGEFIAHLMKIDDKLFIDVFPEELDIQQNDMYKGHFMPVHSFVYISKMEPNPRVSNLEPKWLEKYLEKNPKAIRHEKIDNGILLTAPPKELQKFVLAHLKTDGAFEQSNDFERKKAE